MLDGCTLNRLADCAALTTSPDAMAARANSKSFERGLDKIILLENS